MNLKELKQAVCSACVVLYLTCVPFCDIEVSGFLMAFITLCCGDLCDCAWSPPHCNVHEDEEVYDARGGMGPHFLELGAENLGLIKSRENTWLMARLTSLFSSASRAQLGAEHQL